MLKIKISKILAVLFVIGSLFAISPAKAKDVELLPSMTTVSQAPDRIWVGTFQLVWNDLIENFVKGPVYFTDGNSEIAESLNRKEFSTDNLSENSYYTKLGVVSPKLKKTIEKGIKKKFNEKSDILDKFDWTYNPDNYFIYAMLKKDFKFPVAFEKLNKSSFGGNSAQVDYFGVKGDSDYKIKDNVVVLFYNSPSDFAVRLKTKTNDEVILYRTNADTTFDKYFADVNQKAKEYNGDISLQESETFKVPDINLYVETNFPELENRQIKGTDFIISKTIETVDFRMNNEGVKLKSEAAIAIMKSCLMPERHIRHFDFTDDFVLFLIEKGQNVPYYAMRVSDVEALNKTGRK